MTRPVERRRDPGGTFRQPGLPISFMLILLSKGVQPATRAGARQRLSVLPSLRSSEHFVGYMIMAHLVERFDLHQGGCTPFHLSTRVPGLRTQRQERIQALLDRFETQGFVKAAHSDRMTIYEVTAAGAAWYKGVAMKFMAPFLPPTRP